MHEKIIAVSASVQDMGIAAMKRWWPNGAAPGAIAWINDDVSAGRFPHIAVSVELTQDKDGYDITAAKGGWDMQGITSKFMPAFPPITGIDGAVTFTGPDSLHFNLQDGRLGDIQLQPGTMDISGLNAGVQILKMDIPAVGQLPDMLTLLDTPPYGYAKKYGLKAASERGGVGLDLQVELPLLAALKLSDLKYHAVANLNQVALPNALMGKDISNGKGVFELTPDEMKINGAADIAGVPMQFVWQDFMAPKDNLTRSVTFNSELLDDDHARLGLPTAGYVHGPAKLIGTYEERGGQKTLQTKMDLAAANVAVKDLSWSKPAGAPMTINASLSNNNLSFTATGPDMALDGAGILDDKMQPQKLDFGVFRFGDKTNAKLSFESQNAREHWMITGQSFNAAGLVAADENVSPELTSPPKPPRWIGMKLDSLLLANGAELKNVQAELDHDGKHWDKVLLHGDLHANVPLSINWGPDGKGKQTLSAATDDAGKALSAFGITDTIRGGKLAMTGTGDMNALNKTSGNAEKTSGSANEWLAGGSVKITDFKVVNAPLLAKLLAVTSPGGLLDTLRGDGVSFATLKSEFQYSDAVLRLSGGKMNGQSIGLTFDGDIQQDKTPNTLALNGTIVPLYMLNTVLSGVPILGDILGKDGLLAFNYKATGKVSDPDVSVNPLSALTPGFLRDLLFDNAAPTPEKNP